MADETTRPAPRPAPPPLDFSFPACSVCGARVQADGQRYWCDACDASWPEDNPGAEGDWSDPGAGQCGSVLVPWPDGPRRARAEYRCVLAAGDGHETHQDPVWIGGWTDAQAVAR